MTGDSAVSEVVVLLGRTERWATNNCEDAGVRMVTLHSNQQAPIDTDVTLAVDVPLPQMGNAPSASASAVLVPLPPTMPPLKPCDPGTTDDSVVEVEYWLRLLLTKVAAPGAKEP